MRTNSVAIVRAAMNDLCPNCTCCVLVAAAIREAQQYKGRTWWTMWAQVMKVGPVNHFPTTNGEQEPVKTPGTIAPANLADAKLAKMAPTPRIAQVVVEAIEEEIPF